MNDAKWTGLKRPQRLTEEHITILRTEQLEKGRQLLNNVMVAAVALVMASSCRLHVSVINHHPLLLWHKIYTNHQYTANLRYRLGRDFRSAGQYGKQFQRRAELKSAFFAAHFFSQKSTSNYCSAIWNDPHKYYFLVRQNTQPSSPSCNKITLLLEIQQSSHPSVTSLIHRLRLVWKCFWQVRQAASSTTNVFPIDMIIKFHSNYKPTLY